MAGITSRDLLLLRDVDALVVTAVRGWMNALWIGSKMKEAGDGQKECGCQPQEGTRTWIRVPVV